MHEPRSGLARRACTSSEMRFTRRRVASSWTAARWVDMSKGNAASGSLSSGNSSTCSRVSVEFDSVASETAKRRPSIDDREKSIPQRIFRNGRVEVATDGGGTVMTGHRAVRTTFSVTDPSSRCSKPLRPCVPRTIRSASIFAARSTMRRAGLAPSTASTSQPIPASRSGRQPVVQARLNIFERRERRLPNLGEQNWRLNEKRRVAHVKRCDAGPVPGRYHDGMISACLDASEKSTGQRMRRMSAIGKPPQWPAASSLLAERPLEWAIFFLHVSRMRRRPCRLPDSRQQRLPVGRRARR